MKEITKGIRNEGLESKFKIDGHTVTISLIPGEEIFSINPDPNRTNPKDLQYVENLFNKGTFKNKNFNLECKVGYSAEIENKAKLLISYLLLVRQFGYFFAFSHFGRHIREVLIGNIDDSPLLNIAEITDWDLPESFPLIVICSKPEKFKEHAFVRIPLKTELTKHTYGSFIPVFPGTSVDENAYKMKGYISITGTSLPDPTVILKNPKFHLPKKVNITILDDEN
ncbi:MAG: hypothetical protein JXB38_18715 [Anaerolineales bacterium]|nr:hypothetical protein [Anaerolineales bacterium]